MLAAHFLQDCIKKNKKDIRGFEPNVTEVLVNYDWPGNVRELENMIERSVILCPYDQINMECLPRKLRSHEDNSHPEIEGLNLIQMEKKIIIKALQKTSWNQSQASVLLGISRKQLRTKMKNLGIQA